MGINGSGMYMMYIVLAWSTHPSPAGTFIPIQGTYPHALSWNWLSPFPDPWWDFYKLNQLLDTEAGFPGLELNWLCEFLHVETVFPGVDPLQVGAWLTEEEFYVISGGSIWGLCVAIYKTVLTPSDNLKKHWECTVHVMYKRTGKWYIKSIKCSYILAVVIYQMR